MKPDAPREQRHTLIDKRRHGLGWALAESYHPYRAIYGLEVDYDGPVFAHVVGAFERRTILHLGVRSLVLTTTRRT